MKTNLRFSTLEMLFHVVCDMFPCQAETSKPSTRWADAAAGNSEATPVAAAADKTKRGCILTLLQCAGFRWGGRGGRAYGAGPDVLHSANRRRRCRIPSWDTVSRLFTRGNVFAIYTRTRYKLASEIRLSRAQSKQAAAAPDSQDHADGVKRREIV